ncbi:hypothetical protein [Methylobacterium sp. ARG-1]|uniref:hypothetical protein n=1 Tax=Methylobacterium sp. ARG-1 TaxID=1692501 RepID=UPI0006819C35|nr:hypothetical protein [Methylobacterium sp. ARG-1]
MSVSETLLSIVAFRLAVLVAFVATAQALPARSHQEVSVPRPVVAAPQALACEPATQGDREHALIQDMLRHD